MRVLTVAIAAGIVGLSACVARAVPAADLPAAIYSDPLADKAHPARMVVLHIPSGGVNINGVAYLAAGAGARPTVVLFHGLPGNEKNLDLAQAIRRAGWSVITLNYRGSWGSPGVFRFQQNFEDADAALAFVRDPANAAALGLDTRRIVIIGHSMGGWVAADTAAHDKALAGLVTISAGDLSRVAAAPPAVAEKLMADNMETLGGVTARSMAADAAAVGPRHALVKDAPDLVDTPYLALTSDDGLAGDTDALVTAIRAKGGAKVTAIHVATDHLWSDHRIALEAAVLTWLEGLK